MSDKDRADAEAAARRMASAEDGRCNGGLPAATDERHFWQIHLSTAIVLMFVAAVLLWANLRVTQTTPTVVTSTGTNEYLRTYQVGWPVPWSSEVRYLGARKQRHPVDVNGKATIADEEGPKIPDYDPNPPSVIQLLSGNGTIDTAILFTDLTILILILMVVAFASEYVVCQSEVQKP